MAELPMISNAKPILGDEEQEAVREVLASGMIATGPKVKKFEEAFAAFSGTQHAVMTSNGTTALHAALLAMGVKPGDEVAVPAFTFIATANAVLYAGAKPLLVDVEPGTFCMSPDALRKQITENTRAVLPVHLYGNPADMDHIGEIAAEQGASVLGDAAQAHGSSQSKKPVGALGDAATFSFYPTKNMTTSEGGMVTTDDEEIAERTRSIINHGRGELTLGTYDHVRQGHNFRSSDLCAALGLVQLKRLPEFNAKRQAHAERYDEAFEKIDEIETPEVRLGATHVYHQYTLRCEDREAVLARLKEARVGFGIYYPKALHQYPHLEEYGHSRLTNAERLAQEVVSIPVHPGLSDADVDRVIKAVRG